MASRYIISGLKFNVEYYGYPVMFSLDDTETHKNLTVSPDMLLNENMLPNLSERSILYIKQVLQSLGLITSL